MKITWKALLALFFYTLGVVGWFYVGGWMILRGPVRGVILAHMAGDLSLIKLAVALVPVSYTHLFRRRCCRQRQFSDPA